MDAQEVPLPDHHVADLTKGMEHMRAYVSVPATHNPKPVKEPAPEEPSTYGIPASVIKPLRRPNERPETPRNPEKRTDPFQFGSRTLAEGDDIFEFNAWDHVEVDSAYKDFAETQYTKQKEAPVSDFDKTRFNSQPEKWWNKFYANNSANFFKDRKWLFQEFPSLVAATAENADPTTILELGAGAGNTAFPILAANKNPGLRLHACDFSSTSINVIRANPEYASDHIQADVWDVAAPGEHGETFSLPPNLGPASVDIVILIFIFSALAPSQWTQALHNIHTVLKPGGEVLFRDYGRGDLAQVRFKKGRYLEDNFYIRGDGTRVYFFEQVELEMIFTGKQGPQEEMQEAKATQVPEEIQSSVASETTPAVMDRPRFETLNLAVDRRMLVNRQRKLKMYRCWMQGRFRKPIIEANQVLVV